MSLLRRLKIESFKSIRSVDIDLGQLNIIIGTNGAGKSNILEAVGMLSAAMSGQIEYSRLDDRGVRLSSPEVFRSAFANTKRKITFSIEGTFDSLLYRTHVRSTPEPYSPYPWCYHAETLKRGLKFNTSIAGRSNSFKGVPGFSIDLSNLPQHQSIVQVAKTIGALKEEELSALKSLENYAIYAPSTPILRGVAEDRTRKAPLGLYGGGLAKALSDVLQDKDLRGRLEDFFSLLSWFQQISVVKPDASLQSNHIHTGTQVVAFKEKFMPRSFKKLYAYDVSEGALYILFVLLLLVHPGSPEFFAMDNVDNALNPGLVTSLVELVADFVENSPSKQVIMTTHNPTTLDGIDIFNEKHRLFVVERDKGGETVVNRLKPPANFTKEKWQEAHGYMKLSEIWLSGAIKGINPPKGF